MRLLALIYCILGRAQSLHTALDCNAVPQAGGCCWVSAAAGRQLQSAASCPACMPIIYSVQVLQQLLIALHPASTCMGFWTHTCEPWVLQMVRLLTALKRLRTLRLEACRGSEEALPALSARFPHIHVYQPRTVGTISASAPAMFG